MKILPAFIAALLISLPVMADEEYDPSLTSSDIKYMEDEDIGFNNLSAEEEYELPADGDVLPYPEADNNIRMLQVPQKTIEPKETLKQEKKLKKGATLTDTLQQQEKPTTALPLPEVSGTWVDKLANSLPQTTKKENISDLDGDTPLAVDNLQGLVNSSKRSGARSNASVFDISGIMLRMNLAQAEKAMMVRGFKLITQKLEIPNFIKWRNEEKCRGNGVVGHERIMNCVVEIAKKNNHQYVETAKFSKFDTKEEIEIKLTSNFTGNKIHKITYKSFSGRIVGSGAKAAYLRNIKVYDFWKKVNRKYGAPDNKDEVTWGLGGNKPYMKASTGFLLLEDPMLRELDYTRMSREDQRFMNTDLYSF